MRVPVSAYPLENICPEVHKGGYAQPAPDSWRSPCVPEPRDQDSQSSGETGSWVKTLCLCVVLASLLGAVVQVDFDFMLLFNMQWIVSKSVVLEHGRVFISVS